MWKDRLGEARYGVFINQDTSPLFQLLEGEKISIRYDPSNPNRFYNRAHFQSWIVLITKMAVAIVLGGGFIIWRIWLIFETCGR